MFLRNTIVIYENKTVGIRKKLILSFSNVYLHILQYYLEFFKCFTNNISTVADGFKKKEKSYV